MAVSISAAGQGKLRYPGTPNLKPALSNGQGWWIAFAHKTPPALGGATTQVLGVDSTANGTYSDGNEAGVSLAPNSTRKYSFHLRAGSTDCWVAAGAVNVFNGQSAVSLGANYLVIWGVKDMTGAGDWRLFRVVVPVNGSIIGSEVTAAHANISAFATGAHRGIFEIFADYSTNPRTPGGTAIEHVACVQGDFPFVGGVPSAAIVEGLANGTYQYDDAAVLNGGTILDWRKLANNTDLGNYGSNGLGALAVYSAGSPGGTVDSTSSILPWATFAFDDKPDGYVFEGILAASEVVLTGAKPSTVAAMEAQIELEDGTVFSAWSSSGLTYPSSTTWRLARVGVPVRTDGKDYKLRVRDAANTAESALGGTAWGVGAIVALNGQSQFEIFATGGIGSAGRPTASPNQCRVLYPQSRLGVATGVLCKRLDVTGSYGSAYVAAANEVAAALGSNHIPIMFVDIAYQGEKVDSWVDDVTPTGASWSLWTGYATTMLVACNRRITAMLRADVLPTSYPVTTTEKLLTYFAMWDAVLTANPSPIQVWIMPPMRSGDGGAIVSDGTDGYMSSQSSGLLPGMRTLALSGGRFRLLTWLPDWQMDGNGLNHHQARGEATPDVSADAHIAGNVRGGQRWGLGVASLLAELAGLSPIERFGPQIVSAAFTSSAKTAIDVTFDKDIEVPDGSTTNLIEFWLSTDHWATSSNTFGSTGGAYMVASKVAGNVVRLTKVTGAWTGNPRVAYLRNWFDTRDGNNGGETDIRANIFDRLIYDTSSVCGGRGMVATPYGDGVTVLDFGRAVVSEGETVTLAAAEFASAAWLSSAEELAAGLGPVQFRWKSGAGETGVVTGVDVTLSVTA